MIGKNHAASVRTRLLNQARSSGEDFQRLLVRYAIERLLYRLSISGHRDVFILKGATLFVVWFGKPHRATKDLDLLGRGTPDLERLTTVFAEVASCPFPTDGMTFDGDQIKASPIREDASYSGVRLMIPASLAGAKVKVQVDIGMGDAMVPDPQFIEMTSLLDFPDVRMRAYSPETVVAEKLEALVVLGMTTSRMKDLYDLDLLCRTQVFDDTLIDAIRATFSRRGTPLPSRLPVGFSEQFCLDSSKQAQWKAFLRRAAPGESRPLIEVVDDLRSVLWPVLQQAGQ